MKTIQPKYPLRPPRIAILMLYEDPLPELEDTARQLLVDEAPDLGVILLRDFKDFLEDVDIKDLFRERNRIIELGEEIKVGGFLLFTFSMYEDEKKWMGMYILPSNEGPSDTGLVQHRLRLDFHLTLYDALTGDEVWSSGYNIQRERVFSIGEDSKVLRFDLYQEVLKDPIRDFVSIVCPKVVRIKRKMVIEK